MTIPVLCLLTIAYSRCDAEPEALATYILALLKHDVPEHDLRKEVVMQLNEFFEDGECEAAPAYSVAYLLPRSE